MSQSESWARVCAYELIINTKLTFSQMMQLFAKSFPEYTHVLEEVFMNSGEA
jgi:hypothetical protein